jgi:hypothetical protein
VRQEVAPLKRSSSRPASSAGCTCSCYRPFSQAQRVGGERAQRTHTEEFYQVTACSLEMKKLNRELRQFAGLLTPQQFLLRGSSQGKE